MEGNGVREEGMGRKGKMKGRGLVRVEGGGKEKRGEDVMGGE